MGEIQSNQPSFRPPSGQTSLWFALVVTGILVIYLIIESFADPTHLIALFAVLILAFILGNYIRLIRRGHQSHLSENEARFQTILDNMPVLLLASSADPVPLLWNKECERVTGYSAAEMINNSNAVDTIYPDKSERERLAELGKTRRGDYRNEEFTLTRKDGEKRTIAWTSIAKRVPIPGWASWSVGVDVTARKQAEERTLAAQRQIALITDNLPVLIAYVDRDLRFQFVNHSYEIWFKLPRAEIYGKTKRELVGEAAYTVLEPYIERVLNGEFVQFDTPIVYERAGARYVSETYVPDLDENGRIRGFFVLIQDFSERRHAEERTQLLQRLTAALAVPLTIKEAAEVTIREGLTHLQGLTGAVYLLSEDGQTLNLIAHKDGTESWYVNSRTFPIDSPSIHADAIRTGTPIFMESQAAIVSAYPAFETVVRERGAQAIVAMPIIIKGEPIGVISITYDQERAFNENDRALFAAVAQQCAQALERARLYEAERAARAAAEAAQRQITLITDNLPVLIAYVDRDLRFQFVNHCYEIWFQQPRAEIYGKTKRELVGESAYSILENYIGRVLTGEYVQFDTPIVYERAGARYVSETYVPDMDENGHTRGFFVLVQDFTERRRAEERTQLLQRLTAALTAPLTVKEVAEATIQHGLIHMNGLTGAIYVLNEDGQHLDLITMKTGADQWNTGSSSVPLNLPTPPTDVIRTQTPIFVESLEEYTALYPAYDAAIRQGGVSAILAVPIIVKGEAIGSISISYDQPRTFSADDRALIVAIAQQCAQAMERARLYETERAARTAAEAAQSQLRVITDNLPALVSQIDREQRYIYNNATYEEWFGEQRDVIAGKTIRETLGESAYASLQPHIEMALRGEITQFETRIMYRKVGERYVQISYIPDVDQAGDVKGFFVLVNDLTDRRNAEERTITLQRLTAAFADAITIQQVADTIVTEGLITLGGYTTSIYLLSADETALELINFRTNPADRYSVMPLVTLDNHVPITDVLRTGLPLFIESQAEFERLYPHLIDRIRERGIQRFFCLPLHIAGKVRGVMTMSFTEPRPFTDHDRALLTAIGQQCAQALERVRYYEAERQARTIAEATARENERLYRSEQTQREYWRVTLASIGDAVIVTDEEGKVNFLNSVAESMTGWQLQDAAGKRLEDVFQIVNEHTRESVESPVEQVLRKGVTVGLANHTILIAKDGRETPIDDSGAPIRDNTGALTGVVLVFRDITERRRIEQEREHILEQERYARKAAEHADMLKLRFLGMISHELRTPLASIKGFSSTLLAEDVIWDEDSQRGFITIIEQEADKLTGLVDQLLDLSRLQAGTLRVFALPHRVSQIVQIAMPQLRILTVDHRLVIEMPDDLPLVMVDDQRIAQVLTNLVSNSVKFSPANTPITIRAEVKVYGEAVVQVDVTDEGTGIPLDARAYVFEAFRQGEHARTSKGAGLGLAICKALIEGHNGQIWIDDEYPLDGNNGTRVSFTLPIATEEDLEKSRA